MPSSRLESVSRELEETAASYRELLQRGAEDAAAERRAEDAEAALEAARRERDACKQELQVKSVQCRCRSCRSCRLAAIPDGTFKTCERNKFGNLNT